MHAIAAKRFFGPLRTPNVRAVVFNRQLGFTEMSFGEAIPAQFAARLARLASVQKLMKKPAHYLRVAFVLIDNGNLMQLETKKTTDTHTHRNRGGRRGKKVSKEQGKNDDTVK
jgi:hypothetical protein